MVVAGWVNREQQAIIAFSQVDLDAMMKAIDRKGIDAAISDYKRWKTETNIKGIIKKLDRKYLGGTISTLVNRLLGEVTGTPQEVIHIVGGGSRNALLNQFIADATNLRVCAGPAEATSIGNLLIQAQAGGAIDTLETGRRMIAFAIPQLRCEPTGHRSWAEAMQRFGDLFADRR